MERSELRGMVRTALATTAWALLHTALADHRAKNRVEETIGTRRRNAFYRPIYNGVAVLSLAGLIAYTLRQPKRTIYQVRGPAGAMMRAGQAGGVALLLSAAWHAGPIRFAGIQSLFAWMTGKRDVPRPPAGQGPDRWPDGRVKAVGPFAHLRQPANVAMIPILCLQPRMTSRYAAACVVMTIYAVVGSIHCDRVLAREYGAAFEAYRKRVPIFGV